MPRLDPRKEVHSEAEDVKGENEGNNPFQHSSGVLVGTKHGGGKRNRQNDFDEDENELDPETYPQHTMIAVVDAKTLVLGANEDGGQDESSNKQQQEAVV